MGFINKILGREKITANINNDNERVIQMLCEDTQVNTAFKLYALQICINKIGNAISKCEFKTFVEGLEVKRDNHYLFNYEPNKNQNASSFWNKVIEQMILNDNGALIIQSDDGQLLVADSYSMDRRAVLSNIYSNVEVSNYLFKRTFLEQEVFHLELNNSKVKAMVDGVFRDYGKLISGAMKNYNRSNALKFIVNIDSSFEQFRDREVEDPETGETRIVQDDIMDDLFQNRFKNFLSDRDSVMPLEKGLSLDDMNASGSSKTSGSAANKTTRDITALFEDIINFTADAFNIPRGLLKGDTADIDGMTDNFISFCVNPIAEQISDEINRKFYGKKNIESNTRVRIKTTRIRNYDISKLATPAEMLSRIGVFTVNDILKLLEEETIKEEWANMHIISKNYALVEQLKGGDEANDKND